MRPSFVKGIQDVKMNIWDWVIELLWYNLVAIWLRKQGRFIARLFRWIPVLYKQEDWDYEYMYDLIDFKMQELLKWIEKDDIHTQDCVNRGIRQIKIVRRHLDKYRNWEKYIDYPIDDIKHVPCEDGCCMIEYTNPENDKKREAVHRFEMHHYEMFWKTLKKWHTNWWV